MKHFAVLAGTLIATLLVSANNAVAAEAIYDWSGAYVGVSAGYGWNADDAQYDGLENGVINPVGLWAPYYPEYLGKKELSADGFIGGLQAGANHQVQGGYVFGGEADLSFSGIGESSGTPTPVGYFYPSTYYQDYKLEWFGTARLRAGYAFDRSLVYATGGLAIGNIKVDFESDPDNLNLPHQGNGGGTKVGWVLGGGIEHALSGALSIKGEYLYYDLADTSVGSVVVDPVYTTRFSSENTGHIVRVGLNYHF